MMAIIPHHKSAQCCRSEEPFVRSHRPVARRRSGNHYSSRKPSRRAKAGTTESKAGYRHGHGLVGRSPDRHEFDRGCRHACQSDARRRRAVNLYLDASVIVALLTKDVFTARADAYIRSHAPILIVSDFAGAEFASVIARRVRMREVTQQTARAVFAELDAWVLRNTERAEMTTADVAAATQAVRRLDLTLRTADALNIAIAQRINATLMTLDDKMAIAARALGVTVATA